MRNQMKNTMGNFGISDTSNLATLNPKKDNI